MFLADFHVHSTFSDGKFTIPKLIDFFGSRGFGAIAITDHLCEKNTAMGRAAHWLGLTLTEANFPLYLEMIKAEAERAWDQYKMVVIPGFELSKNSPSARKSAHIVALNVSEYISADGTPEQLARKIRANNGISIAAHPMPTTRTEKHTSFFWINRKEFETLIDVWEVANGDFWFAEVEKTPFRKVANSDFHSLRQLNAWRTVMDCERHPEAILEALLNQELSYRFYQEVCPSDIRSLWTDSPLDARGVLHSPRNWTLPEANSAPGFSALAR